MGTVLELPRNSSGQRRSAGHGAISAEALNLPQDLPSQTAQDDAFWEHSVTEYPVSGFVISDDALPEVDPLPWRQCAVLMVLASVAVYGVGFLIVTGFNHLFHYLQL